MQKLLTFFFSKSICVYAIFNYQIFNDTLTHDIVSLFVLNKWALVCASFGATTRLYLAIVAISMYLQ